ncbi:hypothetical protein HXW73_12045 [Halomonas sp. SH5A2]|uniref:hypothetical protein n=1 Tax=Halomonas sp. SH5A2 TaxID=2749040 RepID=UPI00163E97F3|nr:hypothetical protein [Halomonas sp. SH5A2]QNI03595.1 hypothetical protein HXW73_12045 [Halomonas sp. SH5A2]
MFDAVVSLYRKLDRPIIEDDVFEYSGEISETISALIKEVQELPEAFGRIEINNRRGSFVDLEYFLPSGGEAAFCNSFSELINRFPSISKGVVPENFYIVEEDWTPFDRVELIKYDRLKNICSLINYLSFLAVSVDSTSSPYYNNLFFAASSGEDGKPKTFVVKTKLFVEMLDFDIKHVNVLKTLVDKKHEGKLHIEERRMIFKSSLADVLSLESVGSDTFLSLIESWDNMIHSYWKNLQSYVYGFSFDKIRTEIAGAEIEYCTRLSSSLSEIAGKLLALPVSLAALPFLSKSQEKFDFLIISIGLTIVTVVILCMVLNQWFVASRLKSSFDLVFEQFSFKLSGYPKSIRGLLDKTLKVVYRQGILLNVIFFIFLVLSFVPVVGALYLAEEKFEFISNVYDMLQATVVSLMIFFRSFF